MVNDASVLLWVSLFGTEFFVIYPLTLVVAISPEKLNTQLVEVSYTLLPTPFNWETQFHPK
jgi:hypothetical protein